MHTCKIARKWTIQVMQFQNIIKYWMWGYLKMAWYWLLNARLCQNNVKLYRCEIYYKSGMWCNFKTACNTIECETIPNYPCNLHAINSWNYFWFHSLSQMLFLDSTHSARYFIYLRRDKAYSSQAHSSFVHDLPRLVWYKFFFHVLVQNTVNADWHNCNLCKKVCESFVYR